MKNQPEINKIGAMIREARSAQNMTQQQLADKCDIAKSRIAKAENDTGQMPVSTLRAIIEKGLGGHIRIAFEF